MVAVLALGAAAVLAQDVLASRHGPGTVYVTAQSRFGNGSMTAPIRPARWGGYEVQLSGGAWLACGRDCRETLRREKLDFWETQQEDSGGSGPRGQ